MPAAQWTLGVDAIVKAVGEHSTFIKLVDTVQQAQWTQKQKTRMSLVRYERCINAGMKPELVNATLKQVNNIIIFFIIVIIKVTNIHSITISSSSFFIITT